MLGVLLVLCVASRVARAQAISAGSPDAARILSLENAWNQAEQQKDAKALNLLLAEAFVYIDYDGTLMDKAEFLASVSGKSLRPQQIANLSMKVYVYGKIAIVNGIYRESGTRDGKPYSRRGRFIDTWISVKDTWQCAASQSTLMGQ
jgi:ketosteroid isomerase-like protein